MDNITNIATADSTSRIEQVFTKQRAASRQDSYPDLVDASWPGRIPFFAMTSGTTTGR